MSVPDPTARNWDRAAIHALLDKIQNAQADQVQLIKQQYADVLYLSTLKLRNEYHYLVFEKSSDHSLEFSDDSMELLIGQDFAEKRDAYYNRPAGFIVDLPDCPVRDLSNVQPPFALSNFNLLSKGKEIRVRSLRDSKAVEIPPVINLVIALTIIACQKDRGLFLWQPKKRTNEAGYPEWQRVPDLVLKDYVWTQPHKVAFLRASYAQKRDYLCANGRLQSHDVTLPFLLDFPGHSLENAFDARITADIDQLKPPRAAISIPGAAYIGWVSQFVPVAQHKAFYREEKTSDTQKTFRREFIVPHGSRESIEVPTTFDMYQRAVNMLDNPVEDSLMFYKEIRQLASLATMKE